LWLLLHVSQYVNKIKTRLRIEQALISFTKDVSIRRLCFRRLHCWCCLDR